MTKPNGFSFMRIWLTGVFSILLIFSGIAQTNNSPYSINAIGDLTDNIINRTSGMSSTGIAYRSNRYLITNNPAALSALDNQFFAGELAVNGQYVNYSGNPVSSAYHESSDITFKRFELGTKIFRNLGTSAGIVPFSEENYEYSGTLQLGYTGLTVPTYDEGYGGINKVFWSNGYQLSKNLSIGITSSYLIGSITNKNIIQSPGTSIYISKNNNTAYSNFYFEYGIQYFGSISKHYDFCIGATFANQTELKTANTVTILPLDSVALVSNETDGHYEIPTSFGLGLSITKDKKYTLLADYKYQNWGSDHSTTGGFYYENSQRGSLGFEISNKKILGYNTIYEVSFFQAGLYYNRTYMLINGTPIDDMGASIGIGTNSKRSPLSLNVVFQYGIKGTTANNLIRENYANLSFIFSMREFWYTKGRKFN